MSQRIEHSKLGIASFVIAVIVWLYFFLAGYLFLYGGLSKAIIPKDTYYLGVFGILIIALLIHLILCNAGFLIGSILGLAGVIQKKRKQLFSVIGLSLNAIPLILSIGFAIYLLISLFT